MAWFFMAAGAFAICGAVFDWDFFMNSRKAALLVRFLGRNGARVFYGLLGAGIVTIGVLMAAGLLRSDR
jgi:hypothetical protein